MIIFNIEILRLEIERNSTISFHFRVEIEITPDTTQYTFVEYKSLYLSRCSDKFILNFLNYRFDFSTARLYHDHIVYKSTIYVYCQYIQFLLSKTSKPIFQNFDACSPS